MPLVVSSGLLSASDLSALEPLAETLATETQLRETLDCEGLTIAAGTGASNAHPALRAPSDARAQAARLLDALGSMVSQGISWLFGNPQVQNGISNFFKAASGSFNGEGYSGAFTSPTYCEGGGNQYGFTVG
ncbi:P27 family phage terminase small subunit [Burkholderia ambifaria]|uniref:P27 family phage terminase small subunit n=1 Tax=Burkholderia ambifaria TaxID=152480 RepID=UPI002FE07F6B